MAGKSGRSKAKVSRGFRSSGKKPSKSPEYYIKAATQRQNKLKKIFPFGN